MPVDLNDRDPNDINSIIKVRFEDVIAEPEGVRTIKEVWALTFDCFECCQSCIYKLLTLFCGLCIAIGWGCEFGIVAFNQAWQCTPSLRCLSIQLGCLQKCLVITLNCVAGPYCELTGNCMARLKQDDDGPLKGR
ncbi:CAV1-like protein [Mya arenaria]|uniref:Caveolin n=1 Tax=Mya arenaria TaxID=6604 RepID=A0ABY7FXE1_MYAAR|nr:caveolin-1-like [Mya arenaria]WAR26857.1 CAV1-like protein [Mya arenaria]